MEHSIELCKFPPPPDAVCRLEKCLCPLKSEIYLTDPDFKVNAARLNVLTHELFPGSASFPTHAGVFLRVTFRRAAVRAAGWSFTSTAGRV